MRKSRGSVLLFLVIAFVVPTKAFGWGAGVHAWMADQAGANAGPRNADQIYGALVPDLFNFSFSFPFLGDLYYATHYEVLAVRTLGRSGPESALAFGFLTHNELWGADRTAHRSGLTLGGDVGYVTFKANALQELKPLPPEWGIPDLAARDLFHTFIEVGVDLLLARSIDNLGSELAEACEGRDSRLPDLLVKAYGESFAPYFVGAEKADYAIRSAEGQLRRMMKGYGEALAEPEGSALELLAGQLADLSASFFAAHLLPAPPRDQVIPLVQEYLVQAMRDCEGDFYPEMEATLRMIEANE